MTEPVIPRGGQEYVYGISFGQIRGARCVDRKLWAGVPAVTQYTEGSVVIDVVKPDSRTLLWRGQGKARLSEDAADNVKRLAKAGAAIVAQFPHATSRVVAARP